MEDAALPSVQDYNAVGRVIISSEAYALHEATLKTRLSDYSRVFRVRVLAGALVRAADYIAAQRRRTDLIATTAKAFERFDVLITAPTVRHGAAADRAAAGRRVLPAAAHHGGECRGGAVDGGVRRLHRGRVAARGWRSSGPAWGDATVLRVGHHFEQALGTRARRPALP